MKITEIKSKISVTEIKTYLKVFAKLWKYKEDRDKLEGIILDKLIKENLIHKKIDEEDYSLYLSDTQVLAVIPKKEYLKKLIETNFEVEKKNNNLLGEIEEHQQKEKKSGLSKTSYGVEYLKEIIKLIKYSEDVEIKSGEVSPITFETEDIIIMLSPKVNENG
jgi:hypothetical protein